MDYKSSKNEENIGSNRMKKRNIIISIGLVLIAIIYTILVKVVDVSMIGPENSSVGFSHINRLFHNLIGSNMIIYKITEILGIIPLLMAMGYALIGGMELIKEKSLKKVRLEIYALGGLYVVVLALYVFFEKCIINYRPILIDGVLEASYPSSHTLMALCICMSAVIVNKRIFKENIASILNKISIGLMIMIVLGRLLSGVHWFSDILGGIIISISLLYIFNSIIMIIPSHNKKDKKNIDKIKEDELLIPIKDEYMSKEES